MDVIFFHFKPRVTLLDIRGVRFFVVVTSIFIYLLRAQPLNKEKSVLPADCQQNPKPTAAAYSVNSS